jgi:hypothetical protein
MRVKQKEEAVEQVLGFLTTTTVHINLEGGYAIAATGL